MVIPVSFVAVDLTEKTWASPMSLGCVDVGVVCEYIVVRSFLK